MKVYELSFQKNIRDIGGMVTTDGHHIKYGRLIRGSVSTKLDENDEQIVKGLNITDIIDFRSPDEFEFYPDFHLDGVRMHNLPVLSKKTNEEVLHPNIKEMVYVSNHLSGYSLIWIILFICLKVRRVYEYF